MKSITVGSLAQIIDDAEKETGFLFIVGTGEFKNSPSYSLAKIKFLESMVGLIKASSKSQKTESDLGFNFESIYQLYPLKKGKQRGLQLCRKKIRSVEDFKRLEQAVKNYARQVSGKDPEFIKHFSTFMNCWEDYAGNESTPIVLDPIKMGF